MQLRQLLILLFLSPSLYSQTAGTLYKMPEARRIEKTINSQWLFTYAPETDTADYSQEKTDDKQWQAISLPHTWSTFETTRELHPFIRNASEKDDPYWWYGTGWYRKKFSVSKSESDKNISIEFDGVMKNCHVFLNGKEIGMHLGGFTSFSFDVTGLVRFDTENTLVVEVSNRRNDKYNVPPMTAGNWNLYGGIYRDIRIVLKDRLHIPFQGSFMHEGGTFVSTPKVNEKEALVNIRTWVKNNYPKKVKCKLATIITDAENSVLQVLEQHGTINPNEIFGFSQTSSPVANPKLWSIETPYVYNVYSEVYLNGKLVDTYKSPLGFRWFSWDHSRKRLILNGKEVHIHGTNRHQEYPWLGDAIPKWIHEMDLREIRYNLNHNFIRTCHYTQDKFVYDWCDRNGLVVAEEVPNIKDIDFSETVQEQQVREMIRRDRNHPSILFWSMGNETSDAADSRWAWEEDTTRIIHARHVKGNSAGDFVGHTDEDMDMENLLRCTVRGWYNADVKNLEPKNNQWTGTEEFQHRMAMAEGGSQRGIISMGNGVMWIYADHGADREYVNSPLKHINPKGWVDLYRQPKYIYYLWQANYLDDPMVFIHPHFWREQYIGQKKDFTVDSNCDQVELKVNGKTVGVEFPKTENYHSVTFKDVPVEQGSIEAIASKGQDTVSCILKMAGAPASLVLSSSHLQLEADLASVAIIQADVVDKDGNHVMGANPKLAWEIEGPATLVGPVEWISDKDKHEEMDGTFYIDLPVCNVIRSTGKYGIVKVKVRGEGLEPGEILINVVNKPWQNGNIISEPLQSMEGRKKPVKMQKVACSQDNIQGSLKETKTDLKSGSNVPRYEALQKMISENNGVDTAIASVRLLADVFAKHLLNNNGLLVADDYNFIVAKYNHARSIESIIDTLKLPDVFIDELRGYFWRSVLLEGKNIPVEQLKQNFSGISTDYLLVTRGKLTNKDLPSILSTEKDNLEEIIKDVIPGKTISGKELQQYMIQVKALNPWVDLVTRSESGGVKLYDYFWGDGRILLLPAL